MRRCAPRAILPQWISRLEIATGTRSKNWREPRRIQNSILPGLRSSLRNDRAKERREKMRLHPLASRTRATISSQMGGGHLKGSLGSAMELEGGSFEGMRQLELPAISDSSGSRPPSLRH